MAHSRRLTHAARLSTRGSQLIDSNTSTNTLSFRRPAQHSRRCCRYISCPASLYPSRRRRPPNRRLFIPALFPPIVSGHVLNLFYIARHVYDFLQRNARARLCGRLIVGQWETATPASRGRIKNISPVGRKNINGSRGVGHVIRWFCCFWTVSGSRPYTSRRSPSRFGRVRILLPLQAWELMM